MSGHRLARLAGSALVAGNVVALIACGGAEPGAPASRIPVEATDHECRVTPPSAPAGTVVFEVSNKGTTTTEFYLYGPGGEVVSEVEDIGPGTSREMTVRVDQPGEYTTACKPGMRGAGLRGGFTVTVPRAG